VLLLALLLPGTAQGQTGRVTGTITDGSTGNTLPGVNVAIEGTQLGAVTGPDGSFTISDVKQGTYTVRASFIGYGEEVREGVEVSAGEATDLNFVMQREAVGLDSVVVTGYQTQDREDVTGAVASVPVEDVTSIPASNVLDQLQGQLPGVSVSSRGAPGSNSLIRIRGLTTIGDNSPLYVIDGVPTQENIANLLNPDDIASVQVLKDAAAASIYGTRAANGVVVIETKEGQAGETQVNVSVYSGLQSPGDLPDMLNTREYANVMWRAMKNAGQDPSHPQFGSGEEPRIPDFILPSGASEEDVDLSTYNTEGNQYMRANKEGTDWFDKVYDRALTYNVDLSARGGSENAQFALTGGYTTKDGVAVFTGYKQYSLRANSNYDITDNITVGEHFSTQYTQIIGDFGQGLFRAYGMPPIIPVRDVEGNFAGTKAEGFGTYQNPYASLHSSRHDKDRYLNAFGDVYGQIDFLEDFRLKSSLGFNYNAAHNTDFNPVDYWNASPPASNSLSEYTNYTLFWSWSNTLDYNAVFNNGHEVDALAGAEVTSNYFRSHGASRNSFYSKRPAYRYLGAGTENISNSGSGSNWGLFSLFGKVNYEFDNRYLLSATLRRDGSSRFGPDSRFGYFPAFSAGWKIAQESFMEDVDVVSRLKLRGSWGRTGNQEIGNYPYAAIYGVDVESNNYAIDGSQNSAAPGFDLQSFGNPDVGWETTIQTNIGLDAGFWDDRLSITADVYRKKTTGILLQPPIPATAGAASPAFENIGSMVNRGAELGIDFSSPLDRDLTYELGLNLSHYTNKVTNLVGNEDNFIATGNTRTQEGHPISSYYGYIIDGIFQNEQQVANHAEQPAKAVGRWIYRDVNGDGVVNADDRTYIGNPHPDLEYGFNAQLVYKNFDVRLLIQGTYGNDLYNNVKTSTDFMVFQGNRSERILDTWTPDNRDAELPKLNINNPNQEANKPSTYFIEDGSYLRVRSLRLAYTLPENLISSLGGKRFQVYAQGKNLLTITGYEGFDPVVTTGNDLELGVDTKTQYPISRTYTLGVNIAL